MPSLIFSVCQPQLQLVSHTFEAVLWLPVYERVCYSTVAALQCYLPDHVLEFASMSPHLSCGRLGLFQPLTTALHQGHRLRVTLVVTRLRMLPCPHYLLPLGLPVPTNTMFVSYLCA